MATSRQLGKNRHYRVQSPVSVSFDFGEAIPGVTFRTADWLFASLPACAGHSQMLCPGAMIIGNMTELQLNRLRRTIFIFQADGVLLSTVEAVLADEHLDVLGFWHLESTSDLLVVYKQGLARVFTLKGWRLRELRLFKNPKTQTSVIATSFNKDSFIALFNEGTLVLYEDLARALFSPKQPRSRSIRPPVLSTIFAGGAPQANDIAFLRLANGSEESVGMRFAILATTSESDPDPRLIFFPLSTQSIESCYYTNSELCKAVQLSPGSIIFTNAVLHHSSNCIMVVDEYSLSLAVINIVSLRKDFATGVPRLQLFFSVPSAGERSTQVNLAAGLSGLHSSTFLCAFCDVLPCYYDNYSADEEIQIIIPASARDPKEVRLEGLEASGVFYMEGLLSGLLYKQDDPDEAATMHFVRLNQDLCDIENSTENHAGALLYQISTQLRNAKQQGSSYDVKEVSPNMLLQILEPQMNDAVMSVLSAVLSIDDCKQQMEYLSAAALGKLFLKADEFISATEQYDSIRRRLRILGDFNRHTIGGALPAEDFFGRYTVHTLVGHYSSRGDHERALRTALYFYNNTEEAVSLTFTVLMRLSVDYFLNPAYLKQDERNIIKVLDTNLARFSSVTGIYRKLIDFLVSLERYPRNDLILTLIDKEPVIYDRIALLLTTRNYRKAAELCLQCGIASSLTHLSYTLCKDKEIGNYDIDTALNIFLKVFSPQLPHDQSIQTNLFTSLLYTMTANLEAERCLPHLSASDSSTALTPEWVKYDFFIKLSRSLSLETETALVMLTALFHSSIFDIDINTIIDSLHNQVTAPHAYQITCENLLRAKRFTTCFVDTESITSKERIKKSKERTHSGLDLGHPHNQLKSVTGIMNDVGKQIFKYSFNMLVNDIDTKGTKRFSIVDLPKTKELKKHITGDFKKDVSTELVYLSVCEGFLMATSEENARSPIDARVMRSLLDALHEFCTAIIPAKALATIAYPLLNLLERNLSTEAYVTQSSIYRDLYALLDPVSRARVALQTGKADELAVALENVGLADMEPFSIASLSLSADLQTVIMKARSLK
ncbi:hypothetical protein QR46_0797 [Giardia duodenalis assemblage B]|uniref:Uncharacterized protein n=1 Tax=Giardia duodenalis assemblage B TaxID=1394984 RepID=A0A132NYP4_GIAIN|nr:hypothetical protein QR46_0797 [Giardia intestinalis assemblage B]